MNNEILKVKDLKTTFKSRGQKLQAVRGVTFSIHPGEILGIVGESGSGKSVLMKTVMNILPENAVVEEGTIVFDGKNIMELSKEEKRKLRGKDMAMIFQDPMTALNPLKTIGYHLIEVLKRHGNYSKVQAKERAIEVLRMVGIPNPEKRMKQYPHEFSGGMRQRVLIGMALCCEPKLLIADEPTTALDVTIQAQILDLLKDLQENMGMSIALITHDLGVVASTCSRIIIMYGGLIMEEGTTEEIFYSPKHPYTKALLKAIPRVTEQEERLESIEGLPPSLAEPPKGCPFAERCQYATEKCVEHMPEYVTYSETQRAMCFYTEEIINKERRKLNE